MKRINILLLALFVTALGFAQDNEQLKFVVGSFKQIKTGYTQENQYDIGSANLLDRFIKDWPLDRNANYYTALIRVKFKNLPMSEANKLSFNFPSHCSASKELNPGDNKQNEYWLFVDAVENCWIQAKHPEYGLSQRFSIPMKLVEKGIYEVTLENEKTINIGIITNPPGAQITLDGISLGKSPCQKSGVTYGEHELVIAHNGKTRKEKIDVMDGNAHFEYDIREKKKISIDSDPSKASLYIDKLPFGKTPLHGVELHHGAHEIVAIINDEQADTLNITIDKSTPDVLVLKPIKRKDVEITAKYGGQTVNAALDVNNEHVSAGKRSHRVRLPYGNHNIRVSYNGRAKATDIKVSRKSPSGYELKIPTKNKVIWPWDRIYNPRPFGVSFGYVSKQWLSNGEGERRKENVWGEEDKRLHGIQVGLRLQPHFQWGLGLSTGLFYEYYFSWNDDFKDDGYMDHFQEHSLYMPVHLSYRLPFSENFAVFIQGGLGIDYGVHAEWSDSEDDTIDPVTDYYGEDYCPKRFNLAAEINVGFHIKAIQINAQFSKGLTDHGFYSGQGDYKTRQNKLSLSVSYMIGGSY